MAVQPGIDRALSGSDLDRNASGTALTSSGLFKTSENLDQQGFTLLHLIVLELQYLDLEVVLKYYPIDIDAPDANGRTPLLWASWRGDVASVTFYSSTAQMSIKPTTSSGHRLRKPVRRDILVLLSVFLKRTPR